MKCPKCGDSAYVDSDKDSTLTTIICDRCEHKSVGLSWAEAVVDFYGKKDVIIGEVVAVEKDYESDGDTIVAVIDLVYPEHKCGKRIVVKVLKENHPFIGEYALFTGDKAKDLVDPVA